MADLKADIQITAMEQAGDAHENTATASFASIEYKIRLAAPPLSDAEAEEVLRLVSNNQSGLEVKAKRCVLVQFLDGPNEELRLAGYALRRRAQLEDKECNGNPGSKGDLTLKLRSLDPAVIRASSDWQKDGAKREEDVLIGRAADGTNARQSAWSLSLGTETPEDPKSVEDLRAIFPGVLPSISESLPLPELPRCPRAPLGDQSTERRARKRVEARNLASSGAFGSARRCVHCRAVF
jgi:hypothetical protein